MGNEKHLAVNFQKSQCANYNLKNQIGKSTKRKTLTLKIQLNCV